MACTKTKQCTSQQKKTSPLGCADSTAAVSHYTSPAPAVLLPVVVLPSLGIPLPTPVPTPVFVRVTASLAIGPAARPEREGSNEQSARGQISKARGVRTSRARWVQ